MISSGTDPARLATQGWTALWWLGVAVCGTLAVGIVIWATILRVWIALALGPVACLLALPVAYVWLRSEVEPHEIQVSGGRIQVISRNGRVHGWTEPANFRLFSIGRFGGMLLLRSGAYRTWYLDERQVQVIRQLLLKAR